MLFGVAFEPFGDEAIQASADALHLSAVTFGWGGYQILVLPLQSERNTWAENGELDRLNIGMENAKALRTVPPRRKPL